MVALDLLLTPQEAKHCRGFLYVLTKDAGKSGFASLVPHLKNLVAGNCDYIQDWIQDCSVLIEAGVDGSRDEDVRVVLRNWIHSLQEKYPLDNRLALSRVSDGPKAPALSAIPRTS